MDDIVNRCRLKPITIDPLAERAKQHCDNCYYCWDAGDSRGFTEHKLECRRMAPQESDRYAIAVWPAVSPKDWCGAWRSAAKEEIM